MATSQCAAVILSYLTDDENGRDPKVHIIQRMDYEAVLNITKLPENQGLEFFDKLLTEFSDLDTQNLVIREDSCWSSFYNVLNYVCCCCLGKPN